MQQIALAVKIPTEGSVQRNRRLAKAIHRNVAVTPGCIICMDSRHAGKSPYPPPLPAQAFWSLFYRVISYSPRSRHYRPSQLSCRPSSLDGLIALKAISQSKTFSYAVSVRCFVTSARLCFFRWAVVAHTFNPSTWKAEAGRFLSSRPAWSTE